MRMDTTALGLDYRCNITDGCAALSMPAAQANLQSQSLVMAGKGPP
jgi:hypothetical protein